MIEFSNQSETIQGKFIKKAESFLTSDLYFCTRVWEAWGVGTMSKGDFEPAEESEDFVFELAELLYNTAIEGLE